jgi:hypothetical protein
MEQTLHCTDTQLTASQTSSLYQLRLSCVGAPNACLPHTERTVVSHSEPVMTRILPSYTQSVSSYLSCIFLLSLQPPISIPRVATDAARSSAKKVPGTLFCTRSLLPFASTLCLLLCYRRSALCLSLSPAQHSSPLALTHARMQAPVASLALVV